MNIMSFNPDLKEQSDIFNDIDKIIFLTNLFEPHVCLNFWP